MGSGSSSSYSGGGSQPYAPSYHVTPEMKQYDINNGTYHDGKYDKNPTARKLVDAINGDYIIDKSYTGFDFTYVIDMSGNIIFGKRNGNGRKPAPATPHPTLIGGKNPEVQMAGMLKIKNGKILSYDDRSGHFKPNSQSMKAADEAFSKLPKSLFHKDFKKGVK